MQLKVGSFMGGEVKSYHAQECSTLSSESSVVSGVSAQPFYSCGLIRYIAATKLASGLVGQ